MGSLADKGQPLRLFVFDTARTNCQAFYKLFSQHPQLGWARFIHGFASAALYGPERIQQRLRHGEAAEKTQLEWSTNQWDTGMTYESSNKELVKAIEATEQDGKIFFGKEHCICTMKQDLVLDSIRGDPFAEPTEKGNPTCIPDDVLNSFTPIFVIRHPILMVDSLYRCQLPVMGQLPTDEDFEVNGTLRWCRFLFDYFKAKGGTPALVEAVDFIHNTKPTMDKLCQTIGIDPEGIKESWDPVTEEYFPKHSVAVAFTGKIPLGSMPGPLRHSPTAYFVPCLSGGGESSLIKSSGQETAAVIHLVKRSDVVSEMFANHIQQYLGDMMRSSGLYRKSNEPAEWTIDIDTQTEKWQKLYGDEIAAGLRKRVEVEMPIYEYLRGFKISP